MVIDGETIAFIVGVLTIIGFFVPVAKIIFVMKENIKTLFKKNEEKDLIIAELKENHKDLNRKFDESQKSMQEGMANITQLINDKHIELLNKISEMKK